MKKSALRSRRLRAAASAAAILSGAFAFTGEADAVVILTETFEGPDNVFAMSTYNYSQNYTLPNNLNPGGGLTYGHGGPGTTNAVSTNTFSSSANPYTLLTGGITATQIDDGLVLFNFSAQFSTYREQNDYAEVTLRFLSDSNTVLSEFNIGGLTLIENLPTGETVPERGWLADAVNGVLPTGARFAEVEVASTKSAPGTNIDSYLDNVTLEVTPVPEPATLTLAGVAAAALFRRRRA